LIFSMVPSLRVYQLLLIGMAIGVIATALGTVPLLLAVLLLLLWDALVLAAAFLEVQLSKADRVQVDRLPIERLSIGRDNPIRLRVQTRQRSAKLQIRDAYPQAFTATPPLLQVVLPAKTQEELTYQVFPTQRGDYSWGKIQVRQLGAWGLAWQDWRSAEPQSVAVYPDLVGLRSLSIRLTLQTTGNLKQRNRIGMGTEFAELRDYGSGDDPRLIDWKASARRDRPLLRVLEPEQEQTLIILLDGGRLMTGQVKGLARFDWGLNAALALALGSSIAPCILGCHQSEGKLSSRS
jgi:uncharacterized protein (DUF58 family)